MQHLCKRAAVKEYIIGVDESGRSTIFGPLVYCCFFCEKSSATTALVELGVKDSKKLSAKRRSELHARLLEEPMVGWVTRSLQPREISAGMLQKAQKNLNTLSYQTVYELLSEIIQQVGHPPTTIYLDALGLEKTYFEFLKQKGVCAPLVIEVSADIKYPVVGAASNIAQFIFERELESLESHWKRLPHSLPLGSGQSNDKTTAWWLAHNCDPVFGYPGALVRLSWEPVMKIIQNKCISFEWLEGAALKLEGDNEKKKEKTREKNRSYRKKKQEMKHREKGISTEALLGSDKMIPPATADLQPPESLFKLPQEKTSKQGEKKPVMLFQSTRSQRRL